MNTVFRADASIQIGSGHVMRCLTLADALRERGAEVYFVCRELPGHLGGVLADKGYPVHWLPAPSVDATTVPAHTAYSAWLGVSWERDAEQTRDWLATLPKIDWLIVDHYALDRAWESLMRPWVKRVMVIDDLADRPHDCDLLLDQNLYEDMEQRYTGLVSKDCRLLLGPRYALLRPEFLEARKNLRQRDGTVRRILVFFGGADPSNETAKALRAIQLLDRPDIAVDAVVGSANPHRTEIEGLCARLPNTNFYCQVFNMAELMARADLAIGGCGTATWERCAVALPTLVVSLAENQRVIAESVISSGAIEYIGSVEKNIYEILLIKLRMMLLNQNIVKEISMSAMQINDALGNHRVTKIIGEIL
ncbi:MAG: UDP-2,4-diacetamido-2,4,6-trideoxy-beta-L-altropyranose hydrolase [Candidatus Competibacteraceae bacterium]|nr:UDP-2,4-diacetamido-2,4,6-trideoxy-beta-L-altropyranose hydrolase [Candidatus Competibacteraceae bacterium]